MKSLLRSLFSLPLSALIVLAVVSTPVHGISSYSRQTGLSCNVCHTTPPELTAFGRDFKLNGYSLTSDQITDKSSDKSEHKTAMEIAKYIPIAASIQFSYAGSAKPQPGTQNWNYELPQAASIFIAGSLADHFGSFAQITYSGQDDHFSWDNTDVRYANKTKLAGKNLSFGITFNNNPTVEDLWNSTPAWGFPWVAPDQTPTPIAGALIDGGLAQDVAGLGAYAMWNDHLYFATALYRSEHIGNSQPDSGVGFGTNIQGAAPYWRLAWQQNLGKKNYLELGTYGIHVSSTPNAITGTEDHVTDVAFDAQYELTLPKNDVLSMHTTYIHETNAMDGTFSQGGAAFPDHRLSTFKLDGTYHWGNKYSATAAIFDVWGTVDPLLYAPADVSGSANGNPTSKGYTFQATYWPRQNIELAAQYTGYTSFNGAGHNYDGAGRNASDNNSAYVTAWFIF